MVHTPASEHLVKQSGAQQLVACVCVFRNTFPPVVCMQKKTTTFFVVLFLFLFFCKRIDSFVQSLRMGSERWLRCALALSPGLMIPPGHVHNTAQHNGLEMEPQPHDMGCATHLTISPLAWAGQPCPAFLLLLLLLSWVAAVGRRASWCPPKPRRKASAMEISELSA